MTKEEMHAIIGRTVQEADENRKRLAVLRSALSQVADETQQLADDLRSAPETIEKIPPNIERIENYAEEYRQAKRQQAKLDNNLRTLGIGSVI